MSGHEGREVLVAGDPAGPPAGGHRARRSPPWPRRHPVWTAAAAAALVLALILGGGAIWVDRQINPPGSPGPTVAVSIPSGASTATIGSILAKAGVIHDGSLFRYYVRLTGAGTLYPGTYRLRTGSSYGKVVSALEAGPARVVERLTIPEGFTVRQIAAKVAALPRLHLSAARFLRAASSGEVRSPYEPAGVNNLEGLLFPATYEVEQGDDEVQVLEQMVGAFDTHAASIGLSADAAALHLTPYQVITVASIVEREAKLDADRGPVASVLYNRLAAGRPLGADSTQTYYLRLTDPTAQPTVADLNRPGPYNTRLHTGLPPTPIANPGLPSLEAAAKPPSTPYRYFVEVDPSGKLGFASTDAGFRSLQAQCRAAHLC